MRATIYLKAVKLRDPSGEGREYWDALPFYRYLKRGKEISFDRPVTFLVGENGCGKSTLLEAVAVAMGFNAEGGSKNFNFSTKDTVSELHQELKTVKTAYAKDGFFLRAESFYNVATNLEEVLLPHSVRQWYGGSPHEKSHGESFLALVQNRFSGQGLYLLDEPEAALSPMRQLSLLVEMNRLVEKDSQFIIATHSPILMAYPEARLYKLDRGVEKVCYRDTEHYQVTKDFLNYPETYLGELLEKSDEV